MKAYYEAYDARYRTVHAKGLRWAGEQPTALVAEVASRCLPKKGAAVLELGCGEGRDAREMLRRGYDLLATDVSPEAIDFCQRAMPSAAAHFAVLDFLRSRLDRRFDLIYAVAVLHMLVKDADRQGFYAFLRTHLKPGGVGLICTMGDGETELCSDAEKAFDLQLRDHPAGQIAVAATSCRMVSFPHFLREIDAGGLAVVEQGFTEAMPDFDSLMYAVVRRQGEES